jgi:predicted glycosyltransferase involved in capsule biosynthesis
MTEINHHYQLTDSEFESQFLNCTMSPEIFSHEAHIRLAWIHIRKYGFQKAEKNISKQLKCYVSSLGASDKYNETVTIAAIKAVKHFIDRSNTQDFSEFIKENNKLVTDFKGLLLSHYSTNIFESDRAKLKYIEPELIPFD